METVQPWWANGILFENCDCASVCPAHLSFRQPCNHERRLGYWGFHFEAGAFGETPLDGLNVLIAYDAPQIMFEGDWAVEVYLDDRVTEARRQALETILSGDAGGGWAVVASFISQRRVVRTVPIRFEHDGRKKSLWIENLMETTIEPFKGADGISPVLIRNLTNKIHGPEHGLGLGTTRFDGETIKFTYHGANAIFSDFSWKGP